MEHTKGRRGRWGRRGGERGGGRHGRWGGRRGSAGGRSGALESGDDGPSENHLTFKLGFKELEDLETKTPDEIICELTSSRCFPVMENLLKQQSAKGDWIVLIVSVVSKACDCNFNENLLKLLNLLPGSSFLDSHVRPYLNKLSNCGLPAPDVAVFLRNVVKIMNELLRRFPNCYANLPLSDLYCETRKLYEAGMLADDTLAREVDELMKLRIEKAEELKRKEEEKEKRRKPRTDAGQNDDVNPPENFRRLSVVPTQEDILTGGRPFLRRNKVDGSYDDAEHYLDVQFRLLREDFKRPLREGIAQLLERSCSHNIGSLQDIRVYNNVRLLYPVCTSNGLRYRIKFENSKLRHVRWENSKRLIFGSLVCLSKDKFESLVLATVANRAVEWLSEGVVDIQFIYVFNHVSVKVDDVYQMVESTAFFEAYRHVLEGLKEICPEELPMQNYIVKCQSEVQPPTYLRNRNQEQVTFDLSPIMKNAHPGTTASLKKCYLPSLRSLTRFGDLNVRERRDVPLLNLDSWPSAEELGLDDSQFRALQMALTKEFAVIQGPPGTGKTYIGLKIAHALLHNKFKWKWDTGVRGYDHPVLVVCYTNHALDQFLEGIHQFHPKGIVRIGGRSQSEEMKACSLSELKHKMRQEIARESIHSLKDKLVPHYIRKGIYETNKAIEVKTEALETAEEDLMKCDEGVLLEEKLRRSAFSMTAAQFESLKQPFVDIGGHKQSAIMHWLQLFVDSVNPSQEGTGQLDF